MCILCCSEEDVLPFGLTDDERDEIAERTAEHEAMMALPRCPICGEGPQFFKNGACPYINAEDHKAIG